MNVNYHYFKGLLVDKQLSQRRLAGMMHLDPSAVHYMFRGGRAIKLDEAVELAKILEVPLDEVLQNAGIDVPDFVVRREGHVSVTGWVDDTFKIRRTKWKGPKKVEAPPTGGRGVEALRCQNNTAFNGAMMYYSPRADVAAEAIGRLCVTTDLAGAQAVRVVQHGYQRGTYNIGDIMGGVIQENVKLSAAAVVVWVRMAF